MFCEKCGTLMTPMKDKYVCPSCHFELTKDQTSSTRIVSKGEEKSLIVIKEEKIAEPLDSDAVCPKCQHTGAYYLLKQTRSADEPETKFYTCQKCGHRWREY